MSPAAEEFHAELASARRFEEIQTRRQRGVVLYWIGLLTAFIGGGFLIPELDEDSPRLTVISVIAGVVFYIVLLLGSALYFRYAFRWRGIWNKANSWTWDSLGGFLGAWWILGMLASPILLFSLSDPASWDHAEFVERARLHVTRTAALQLATVGLSLLAINIRLRNPGEMLLGVSQAALGIIAFAMVESFVGFVPLLGLSMCLPTILLGLVRIVAAAEARV